MVSQDTQMYFIQNNSMLTFSCPINTVVVHHITTYYTINFFYNPEHSYSLFSTVSTTMSYNFITVPHKSMHMPNTSNNIELVINHTHLSLFPVS